MRPHIVMDMVTGEIRIQGRDGRLYLKDEVDRALIRAAGGDPQAKALVDDIDFENKNGIDVIDPMQLLHDCPDCRAAMARGEVPQIVAGEALEELMAEYLRSEAPIRPRTKRRGKKRRHASRS